MTDFTTITACGECCVGCTKKIEGSCPGCIEADGRVPEWAESGLTVIQTEERDPGIAWFRVRAIGEVAHLLCEGEPISDSGFKG